MQNSTESKVHTVPKTVLAVVIAIVVTALLLGLGYAAGMARGGAQVGSHEVAADANAQFFDIKLFIGHEVAGVPTLSSEDICAAAEEVLGIESYTAQEADGVYENDHEDSTVISILQVDAATKDDIVENVPRLAARLQQESILVSIDPSTADLIYAE